MSLAKQIGIGVLATLALVLFGFGSYAASTQIFPDPKASPTSTVTPTGTSGSSTITVSDVKHIEPQSIKFKKEGDDTVISFETAEKVGATIYVTSSSTERIVQTMKDKVNGIPVIGAWFDVTSKEQPLTTHSVTIPKKAMATSGNTYFYILLNYKKMWTAFGAGMDYTNGPTEPYIMR